jgi:hypothetical protein
MPLEEILPVDSLAEQIELARKQIEALPEWLRRNNHFAGDSNAQRDPNDESA